MKYFLLCLPMALLITSSSPTQTSKVYVCVGGSAYAYHLKKECRGLNRCTHSIKEVTLQEAKETYKRKLCGWED